MFSPNSEAITSQLTADYAVNTMLMGWSHTLLNTTLYPLQPKPAWFDSIDGALKTAKTATQEWLTKQYPDIAAALPQSLITYGTLFKNAAPELIPLFAAGNPTGDARDTALELIDALLEEARRQQFRVLGLQRHVVTFSKLARDTSTQMAKDAKEVTKSLGDKQKDVLALQSRIADLERRLGVTTTEAKNSMQGAAMTGATCSMTLMSFTLSASLASGVSVPVLGLAGAFIGIAVNAAMEAARSKEVLQLIREIGDLQQKLSAEQHQMAALETMQRQLESLSDVATTSLTNMNGIVHHWDDIVTNLVAARELLVQPAADLSKITSFTKLADAQTAWQTIVERAGKVQQSSIQKEPSRIVVTGDAA